VLLLCIVMKLVLVTILCLGIQAISIAQTNGIDKKGSVTQKTDNDKKFGIPEESKERLKRKESSKFLKKSLEKNQPDSIAKGYYELGNQYFNKKDFIKSEAYYRKAKNAYNDLNNLEGVVNATRGEALSLEQQDKNIDAEATLRNTTIELGNKKLPDSNLQKLIANDVKRLNTNIAQEKIALLQGNIDISRKLKDTVQTVNYYNQLANENLSNGKINAGIQNLKEAFNFSTNAATVQKINLNQSLTTVLAQNGMIDEAIITKKELLSNAEIKGSSLLTANQYNALADLYVQKAENVSAIGLYKQALNISIKNGHTEEALRSLKRMDSIYKQENKTEELLTIYKNFLTQLPDVITKDTSFFDNELIKETEERIVQLEKDKLAQANVIKRRNIFNYTLGGISVLLFTLIGLVAWLLKRANKRNKQIALQSLRREMNPHFIFNSLNSVNQYIATSDELSANRYLTKFSALMRSVMENSKDDFISLEQEVSFLNNYLELENSRFKNKFTYEFSVDERLPKDYLMPVMLLQPFIENAVWHGLRYLENDGYLNVTITQENNNIVCSIEDNGIGIAASKALKTANQLKKKSRGINNTYERIALLNSLYKLKININTTDKQPPETGVMIQINLPKVKTI
jgi:TPR repeat protein